MTRLSVFLAILALSLLSLHPMPAAAQQMAAAADSSMQPAGSATDTSTHVSGTAHHTTSHKHHTAKTAKKPKVVDINSATDEQLETLPGVTEAMSDKIVQNRPYKSVKDLVTKQVMTQAEYDKIHSHITAKQAAATTTK